ncbi:phospholipid scramblase 1-like [Centruroides vittatus]|uniref:phospholipid scramblase 1-like n=1 Tax=Centruroides vittatus TaxID=120091 RepID=UPI00350F5DBE
MSEKQKNALNNSSKNGVSIPLTPPENEEIPFADDDVSNEEIVKGVVGEWMPAPTSPIDCPPGLEYLCTLDKLFVEQEVQLLEALTGFETANKYSIKNELGQIVYYAVEETDCLTRNLCGPIRPFEMKLLNSSANEIISLSRPLRCMTCWCPCFLQELEVMAPPGTKIGLIKQDWSIMRTKFSIQNHEGEKMLSILGPCCNCKCCNCCCDVNFKVYDIEGNNVGKISKKWSNLAKEAFTNADVFGISFPKDLDVTIKAVVLGACFLIDFMFFERSPEVKEVKQ